MSAKERKQKEGLKSILKGTFFMLDEMWLKAFQANDQAEMFRLDLELQEVYEEFNQVCNELKTM